MRYLKLQTLLVALFMSLGLSAQLTTVYTEANEALKRGEDFFEKGLFGAAQNEYSIAINKLLPVNEPTSEMLIAKAELGYAKAAVRQDLPDGEKLMLDFIRKYSPEPISNQALIEVANYYYNSRKYEKATKYFSLIPSNQLTNQQKAEVSFKIGYSLFVKKKFKQAKSNFSQVKNIENKYYYPTNYYLGLCEFFDGKYDNAIRQFRLVEGNNKYKGQVPYYITQIFFAEKDYDQLIAYAEPKLKDSRVQKRNQMNQLVGQAYFEKGDYATALPFLEYAAARLGKMSEAGFYQLGFAQYQSGEYKKAAKNFKELNNQDSPLGQNALYYLADTQLKDGKKADARKAFAKASRMDYDPSIKEESVFNYAKLSYELKYDTDAITALQGIKQGSKYYSDSQNLLGKIFVNTRDYQRALNALEKIPNKTAQLKEAYQKVSLNRGLQLYADGDSAGAKRLLTQAKNSSFDQKSKAIATFWLAEMANGNKQYDESIKLADQFITLAKNTSGLPDESSIHMANYLQGQNYLRQLKYARAEGYFSDAVRGIQRNSARIKSTYVRQNVLGDAVLRAGDCNFSKNRYKDALAYYDTAIDRQYSGFVYALYQKAIIEGLQNNQTEKILALENIADNYSNSEYADDALLALGVAYQDINQLNKATQPLKQLVSKYNGRTNLMVPALLRLGLINYAMGAEDASIEYYKKVFSHNPDEEQARAALTALEEIYVEDKGDPDKYFAFLETVPGYKPDNMQRDNISFKAALTKYEYAEYDKAAKGFTDYIRKFPNGRNILEAYYSRADSYLQLKDYNKALDDLEWVISKGQSKYYTDGVRQAAILSYNIKKDFAKAYEYYTLMEKVAPNEEYKFQAQLGAMRAAYRTANTSAVNTMAQKVANNPQATPSQQSTANFYLGKIAYDNKNYDAAISRFNQVIKNSNTEDTAEARYLVAMAYYQKRDLATATTLAEKASTDNVGYIYWVAKSMILLADAYAEQGDFFSASAYLESLLAGYNEDPTIVKEAKDKLAIYNKKAEEESNIDSYNLNSETFEMEEEGGN